MTPQDKMPCHLRFFIAFFAASLLCLYLCSSAMLAPIRQERSSHLYSISLYTRTPSQATNLILDLRASFNWVDCSHNYTNSTIPCTSSLCNGLDSHVCSDCSEAIHGCSEAIHGCSNKSSCFFSFSNSGERKGITKALALADSLALPITDGRNPGHLSIVQDFIFSCSASYNFFKGRRMKGTTGLAGLGQSNFSLIAQLSTRFSLPRVFALCLSGSPSAPGLAFFGTRGPYHFHHETDLSKNLTYTQLFMKNPAPAGGRISNTRLFEEYFINLTAIKVNGKILQFDMKGNAFGQAMLSTTTPYTTLHSSIYKALVGAFVNESAAVLNLTITQPVKPFSVCYDVRIVSSSRLGPLAPTVDFVMQSDDVFWRVHGSNSMVRIAKGGIDVWCLGFLDGGTKPRSSSIVIGGHQMVDNLLQFDLETKRLGFSSSVLVQNSMCANFNFTVNHNLL